MRLLSVITYSDYEEQLALVKIVYMQSDRLVKTAGVEFIKGEATLPG